MLLNILSVISYIRNPPPGLDNPYDEFKNEIRNQMESILKKYDGINTRSIAIQK